MPAPLRPDELNELREDLELMRGKIARRLDGHKEDGLEGAERGGDEADQAAWEYERMLSLRFAGMETQLLEEIDHALLKFADGEYGLCEGTGAPIGFRRLKARPWARYSVVFKEQLEHQQRHLAIAT